MANLLINPLTKKRLDSFIGRPSHALLLTGQEGSGLNKLADFVRKALVAIGPDAETLVSIEPNEKGTITIDSVRELSHRLKLRNSAEGVAVVCVINHAETMPTEAQNSLLKLLEEPPKGVLFIVLAYNAFKILPTISSRCVTIEVLPVSLDQAQNHFRDSSEALTRLYRLSGGQAGLLEELRDSDDHPLTASIEEAKKLLSASPYDRIKRVDGEFKQREAASLIVNAILRVCSAGLQSGRASARWIHNCRISIHALQQLEANVQPKLVLDHLFLNVR